MAQEGHKGTRDGPQNKNVDIVEVMPITCKNMKKLVIAGVSYIGGFNSFDNTTYIGTICIQIERNMNKILTSQYNCLKLSMLSSGKTCLYNLLSLRGKESSISRT
jgi:hypothetical protein